MAGGTKEFFAPFDFGAELVEEAIVGFIGSDDSAAGEGIDEHAVSVALGADQKMAGEADAVGF